MMKLLRKYLCLVLLLSFAILITTKVVKAQTPMPNRQVIIYLFWGDGCPHCARAKPYFESLPARYPGLVLKTFEIYYSQENQQFFAGMAQKYGLEQLAVPTIFIGPHYLQGYSEELNQDIEGVIQQCLQNGCADPAEGISKTSSGIVPTPSISPQITMTPMITATPISAVEAISPIAQSRPLNQSTLWEIPFIGSVNLEMQSITLSTALIALVDGFNPCSLWVLSMLLALTLHTGSRKKVFAIGLVFLTITALIYMFFITGLFSVLKVSGFLGWIQILVSLVALFFALVNIKDYFWYKEGISLTIAEDKKSGIFKRIRSIINASQSFWGLVSATVVLAAGVSMVEFSCTAGFPVIWVNLLSSQKISGVTFLLLLFLYMFIYQLDELVIFFSAVISLKSNRLQEKHGRLLKLIGGMLMLILSVVMLANPALMNNLLSTMVIFGSAFIATLIVLLIHRFVLPKLGIRIGSESRQISNKPEKTK